MRFTAELQEDARTVSQQAKSLQSASNVKQYNEAGKRPR